MVKKEKFVLIYIIMVAFVIGLLFAFLVSFYIRFEKSDKIQPGVFVGDVNISGLTQEEAIEVANENLNLELNDHITLKYKNYEYYVEIEQIDAKFNIEESVKYAYQIGRSGSIIKDLKDYFTVLISKIVINPVLTYDKDALDTYMAYIEAILPDQLEQSSYYVDGSKLIITNGKNGAKIYMDELEEDIIATIKDKKYKKRIIDIPTYIEVPDKINVQAIHDDIYREAQDAYFTVEPRMVYASVVGVDFNADAVRQEIEAHPAVDEYVVGLTFTKPKVTVDDLGMDPFPDLIGTYSTKYINNANRTINLVLASNKINGTVIMPGEKFSFNKVVGKRTAAAGYKEAAIFSDGQVTDGLGGGICQVTTTLYNAVVRANLSIVSRRNHMFVPSYAKGGCDATVVYGSTDFVFKNSRSYPIKIVSSVSGGIAKVSIYGYKNDNDPDYDISIESKLVKSTGTSLVYDAYKVYKVNGQVVNREKLSRDTYKKY